MHEDEIIISLKLKKRDIHYLYFLTISLHSKVLELSLHSSPSDFVFNFTSHLLAYVVFGEYHPILNRPYQIKGEKVRWSMIECSTT